jgi:hypothetical protein
VSEWREDPVLGWAGTHRQVKVDGMTGRLRAAIAERASELGIEVAVDTGAIFTIVTGSPKEHLGADKLIAYIDGLHDALSDTYGNPPVQVGRKDLERLLGAVSGPTGAFLGPDMAAVTDRMRQALREPPE